MWLPKDVVFPNIISENVSLEALKRIPEVMTLKGGLAGSAT
jgi:hypothetical protein